MTAQLLIAGTLVLAGAGVHGIGGEVLVLRNLSDGRLAGSRFGGPRMTRAMIHVTWHLTTAAFFGVGLALVLAGTTLNGEAAQAVGLAAAGMCSAFAAVMVGVGVADTGTLRSFVSHPAPLAFMVAAGLAWWGALSV
jgi:hypothetical protein